MRRSTLGRPPMGSCFDSMMRREQSEHIAPTAQISVGPILEGATDTHGRPYPSPSRTPVLMLFQVVVEYAKGSSGFRLFAAMVENDLVVTSNPAKFASPVRESGLCIQTIATEVYRSTIKQRRFFAAVVGSLNVSRSCTTPVKSFFVFKSTFSTTVVRPRSRNRRNQSPRFPLHSCANKTLSKLVLPPAGGSRHAQGG